MAQVRYLGCLIIHDSHTVEQPNCISPKVLTAMGAQQTLEPDYGRSHLPFPSFTSIQCALIPWNDILVVSADHPSIVTETFPGAAWWW